MIFGKRKIKCITLLLLVSVTLDSVCTHESPLVVRVTQNQALVCNLPDAGAGIQDIKILQNVRESHQPQHYST